jgi:hypothetical protein
MRGPARRGTEAVTTAPIRNRLRALRPYEGSNPSLSATFRRKAPNFFSSRAHLAKGRLALSAKLSTKLHRDGDGLLIDLIDRRGARGEEHWPSDFRFASRSMRGKQQVTPQGCQLRTNSANGHLGVGFARPPAALRLLVLAVHDRAF